MDVLKVDYLSSNREALLSQSLHETGFAVLINHPITTNCIRQAYEGWQAFFASPNKQQYAYQKPAQDGYFAFRVERAKNSHVSDLKEFYHFYKTGKVPPELKIVTLDIFQALTELATDVLQWVENQLPAAVLDQLSMPLTAMIKESPNTLLRILHYPPISAQIEMDAVRAAPHEDINLLTLLPAATAPGLQVLSHDNRWYDVNCDVGNVVINVGDMLQLCTQGFYKSTTHRVVNPDATGNVSRFSMPLFLHPHPDVKLSDDYSAQSYLHERLRQIGIY